MQNSSGIEKVSIATETTRVQTHVPLFFQAKANDISAWATEVESRSKLATLLRILVNSTCDGIKNIDFPAHDDSQRQGWDGEVETSTGCPWVPEGYSGWEFGTSERISRKANEDFHKRVQSTLEKDRREMSFVFVTPRRWNQKKNWRNKNLDRGGWKNIKVLDASDLEQWMEKSISAQVWFANERGKKLQEARSLDRCWMQWKADCDPPFTVQVFREAFATIGNKLAKLLKENPEPRIRIGGDSIHECLAFLFSVLDEADPQLIAIRDRIVVFSKKGSLTELMVDTPGFFPVVTTNETERELAETNTHVGRISIVSRANAYKEDSAYREDSIALEPLSENTFRKALESMKLKQERINRLANESGRSLTVLRRRLGGAALRSPEWNRNEALARMVFPFMLAGMWNKNNEKDKLVMKLLADCNDYEELEIKFIKLSELEESPVWVVGAFRGIISKIDSFYAARKWVTEGELNRFWKVMELILSERFTSFNVSGKNISIGNTHGEIRDISSGLREGLIDSIVFLSVHGNRWFRERIGVDTQARVNESVRTLWTNMDTSTLKFLAWDLPQCAEAAPEEFLRIVESDLASDDSKISNLLMRSSKGLFILDHSWFGLLSALEMLAWPKEHLARVVEILSRLTDLEHENHDFKLPIRILLSIFCCWAPQTAALIGQRISIFNQLVNRNPHVAWKIARDQNRIGRRILMTNIKPKWRDFAFGHGEVVTRQEASEFVRHCQKAMLSQFSLNKEKLVDLIEDIEVFSSSDRVKVWEIVDAWGKNASIGDRVYLREIIRDRICRLAQHENRTEKSNPETKSLVKRARKTYDRLELNDIVAKHAWLFKNVWTQIFWEEIDGDLDHDERMKLGTKKREAAVREIYRSHSDDLENFADAAEDVPLIGQTLAKVLSRKNDQRAFIKGIVSKKEFMSSQKLQDLVGGFLSSLDQGRAIEHVNACRLNIDDSVFVRLFCLCDFSECVWKAVEEAGFQILESYWKQVSGRWRGQSEKELCHATDKFLKAQRVLEALRLISFKPEKIDSDRLCKLLQKASSCSLMRLDLQTINKIFEILDSRGNINRVHMIQLELLYVNQRHDDSPNISNFEAEINEKPQMFCKILSLETKGDAENQEKSFTEEDRLDVERARSLISFLSKIPGRDVNGNIEADALKDWIMEARRIANGTDYEGRLDVKIGEILSNAPKNNDGTWPCKAVSEVVEELYGERLAHGILIGRFNARGATFRDFDEGGDQERVLVRQYEDWATACELEFPRMASVLRLISDRFQNFAELHDDEAMIKRRSSY